MGGVNCKGPSQKSLVEMEWAAPVLTIKVGRAKGLHPRNWFPETDVFVHCVVKASGGEGAQLTTKVQDIPEPTWNEEVAVAKYKAGGSLTIEVVATGSQENEVVMGVAELWGNQFEREGFAGDVELKTQGSGPPAWLQVCVKMEGQEYPPQPAQHFEIVFENPKKKALGVDFDSQDGTTLHIMAVKNGPVQTYNKDAKPTLQLKPGDFIVQVDDDVKGDSKKLNAAMQQRTTMKLLVKRQQLLCVLVKKESMKASLGFEYSKPAGKAVLLSQVNDEGPIQAWNAANPDQRVKPGDRIIEVCGQAGTAANLLKKAQQMTQFQMTIARPANPDSEEPEGKAGDAAASGGPAALGGA